jgi:hypothetical protein
MRRVTHVSFAAHPPRAQTRGRRVRRRWPSACRRRAAIEMHDARDALCCGNDVADDCGNWPWSRSSPAEGIAGRCFTARRSAGRYSWISARPRSRATRSHRETNCHERDGPREQHVAARHRSAPTPAHGHAILAEHQEQQQSTVACPDHFHGLIAYLGVVRGADAKPLSTMNQPIRVRASELGGREADVHGSVPSRLRGYS